MLIYSSHVQWSNQSSSAIVDRSEVIRQYLRPSKEKLNEVPEIFSEAGMEEYLNPKIWTQNVGL